MCKVFAKASGEAIEIANERMMLHVSFIPAQSCNVNPPIVEGVETMDWLRYDKGSRPKLNSKTWVERHLGWKVQEYV